MQTYQSHETDGIRFTCAVTFEKDSGATTMIGGAASALAKNIDDGTVIVGSASITGLTRLSVAFTGVTAGDWLVQVIATPAGHPAQTVSESQWAVSPSITV